VADLLARLSGPLDLERKRGWDDSAVVGGLGPFVGRWAGELSPLLEDAAARDALEHLPASFTRYSQATPARRRRLCEQAHALLQQLSEGKLVALRRSQSRTTESRQCAPADIHADTAPAIRPCGKSTRPTPSREPDDQQQVTWDGPLTALQGVGPVRAQAMASAGISTVGQLLTYYPTRYRDRPHLHRPDELCEGEEVCLLVRVAGKGRNLFRGRIRMSDVPAVALPPRDAQDAEPADQDEAPLTLRWFGQPYRARQFTAGSELVVAGRVHRKSERPVVVVQECETAWQEDRSSPGLGVGKLVPIYSRIEGIGPLQLRRLIRQALELCHDLEDLIPPELASSRNLMPLKEALRQTHFPDSAAAQQQAQQRLVYQDLLALQTALTLRRLTVSPSEPIAVLPSDAQLRTRYENALPFALTGAQQRVMDEVAVDLAAPAASHRLIHGDVGSGKTVVAAWAMYCAVKSGRQAALMAPTELLAEQHYRTLRQLTAPLGITPLLLTGSVTGSDRRQVLDRISAGEPVVVVGTHALFQDGVQFSDLAVVVIDEQHRFGLAQRAALEAKGNRPNLIVMSATPIPRTLALTLYGDFDISVLDELPPGRTPVHTRLLPSDDSGTAVDLLRAQVRAGRQAYVICPLISDDTGLELSAATEMHRQLEAQLAASDDEDGIAVGLVHGRMTADTREEVMEQFRAGQIQVLVSTTVVEVGVDVPNATLMVVHNAERFGLPQLHQLRGRVARSAAQAHCILLTDSDNPEVLERLSVLEQTGDGFRIAEEDLRRRGPGEMAGLAQHGLPDVHMAALLADTPSLLQAREDAHLLVERDPQLQAPQHRALRKAVAQTATSVVKWTI
jgi:ATP-dependent DNA helicase RecG